MTNQVFDSGLDCIAAPHNNTPHAHILINNLNDIPCSIAASMFFIELICASNSGHFTKHCSSIQNSFDLDNQEHYAFWFCCNQPQCIQKHAANIRRKTSSYTVFARRDRSFVRLRTAVSGAEPSSGKIMLL